MTDGLVMIGFGLAITIGATFMSSRSLVLGEIFIDPGEISKRRTPVLYWILGSIRALIGLIGLVMAGGGVVTLIR